MMVEPKNHRNSNKKSRKDKASKPNIKEEIESLNKRILDEAPAPGYTPPLQQCVAFRALPLSTATLRGLEEAQPPFTIMTDIQNACIPHALSGRDILGAARTGSGKTLAYLIPLLELLYRHEYTPALGPGATILSPTRELAVQIYQVLRVVGKHHSFSVGLLIGGKKDFDQEQQQVGQTNILIATPGRLLQHLEQTPYFDMSALRILVLDEADRILDMGFRDQLVRILEYLPRADERQTLLFSATQTRDVSNLAMLSLSKPEYLGVHDKEKTSTPQSLEQSYVVVPLEHKLNAVYSFIKTHLKCKSIIFMATCSQVRHAWELFCALRPGVPIMALHGKLVQTKRTEIYFDFLQRPHAVLFATDIAARGLDFPHVDWVVQVDAPEDRDMYVHRAGRTARYRAGGKSLLMLTPSEERKGLIAMIQGNNPSKVPLKKLSINPSKTVVVSQRAASMVAADVNLHRLAKKAFQSYVRCIYLMPHKEIFDVQDIPVDEFSQSLGLAATPNLQFLKKVEPHRSQLREKKNVNRKLQKLKEQIKAEKLAKKVAKMSSVGPGEAKSEDANGRHHEKQDDEDDDEDDDDDLLVPKEPNALVFQETTASAAVSLAAMPKLSKRIRIDGPNGANTRIVFRDDDDDDSVDDDGANVADAQTENLGKGIAVNLEEATSSYMDLVRKRLQSNMAKDRAEEKERVRQKHKKRRLQDKEERNLDRAEGDDEPVTVTLGAASEDDDPSSDMDSESDSDLAAQEDIALALIRQSSITRS